jgi:hypothetical protein
LIAYNAPDLRIILVLRLRKLTSQGQCQQTYLALFEKNNGITNRILIIDTIPT